MDEEALLQELLRRKRLRQDDALVRAIVDDNRAPLTPRSVIPEAGRPKIDMVRPSGFVEPRPLETPYVREVDRIADHFDRLDRLDRVRGKQAEAKLNPIRRI